MNNIWNDLDKAAMRIREYEQNRVYPTMEEERLQHLKDVSRICKCKKCLACISAEQNRIVIASLI